MRSRENVSFLLADRSFYEPLDRYKPNEAHLLEPTAPLLPSDWSVKHTSAWFVCMPPVNRAPAQGWKIHVSSSVDQAAAVLDIVARGLVPREVGFKFALDFDILASMNSKNWSRGGAAKFITIYPHDEAQFVELLCELYNRTREFSGPYVLSDKRYRDSRVLYYRYGGLKAQYLYSIEGERSTVIQSPTGEPYFDDRQPWFQLPPWIPRDPVATGEEEDEGDGTPTLHCGRYLINKVLAYSNAGGVYVAQDREANRVVVIKEARPHIRSGKVGADAQALLEKEYRLLALVAGNDIAPKPYEVFDDWEHRYLVEEYLDGLPLSDYNAIRNVNLLTRPQPKDFADYYAEFRTILLRIAEILDILHGKRIVFSDLSPRNLVLANGTLRLKIIDFEGAFQEGRDEPIRIFTPGFVAPDQIGGTASFATDLYAFGAIALAWLFPANNLYHLRPSARFEFLEELGRDVGIGPRLSAVMRDLVSDDPHVRPPASAVVKAVTAESAPPQPRVEPPGDDLLPKCRAVRDQIAQFILGLASPGRDDRLFPSDSRLFVTNPMSVAFGATGVARALALMGATLPDRVVDWMHAQELDPRRYPPGLYFGLSGIACALWDCGMHEKAIAAMDSALKHPLRHDCFDVFFGKAGIGLACLNFHVVTGKEEYLQAAHGIAGDLASSAQSQGDGLFWTHRNDVPFGFGHGSSGAAVFLAQLYQVSGARKHLELAQAALQFDLDSGLPNLDGGLSWPYTKATRAPLLPYFRYGSAGVGMAALRLLAVTKEERYLEALERIVLDTNRKYAVGTGLFLGLAGLGEFCLDAYDCLGETRFHDMAKRVASGLLLFAIPRSEGVAFPGERLVRISCDYGTGAAGVALFFHRLITGKRSLVALDYAASEHAFVSYRDATAV